MSTKSIFHSVSGQHEQNSKLSLSLNRTHIAPKEMASFDVFVKSIAIDGVGYTTVPDDIMANNPSIPHKNAIVLILGQQTGANNPQSDHEAQIITDKVVHYLRGKGFVAQCGEPVLELTVYPQLGELAGLGWRGIHGRLITPQFGPWVRLVVIFTSIENLPVAQGNDHTWIADYCKRCELCTRQYPSVLSQSAYGADTDRYIRVCPFNQLVYDLLYRKMTPRKDRVVL